VHVQVSFLAYFRRSNLPRRRARHSGERNDIWNNARDCSQCDLRTRCGVAASSSGETERRADTHGEGIKRQRRGRDIQTRDTLIGKCRGNIGDERNRCLLRRVRTTVIVWERSRGKHASVNARPMKTASTGLSYRQEEGRDTAAIGDDRRGLEYPESRCTFHRDNAKFISRTLHAVRNWGKNGNDHLRGWILKL